MSSSNLSQRSLLFTSFCGLFALVLLALLAMQFRKDLHNVQEGYNKNLSTIQGSLKDVLGGLEEPKKRAAAEAALQAALKDQAALQADKKTLEEKATKADGQAQALKKDLDALAAAAAKTKEELDAAKKDLTALQADKKALEEKGAKSDAQAQAYKKDLDALAAADAKTKEELQAIKQDRTFLQTELKTLRAELEERWNDSAVKIRESSDEVLKSSSDSTAQALAEVQKRVDATQAILQGGSVKLENVLARSEALAAEVARLTKKLEEANDRIAALKAGQGGAQKKVAREAVPSTAAEKQPLPEKKASASAPEEAKRPEKAEAIPEKKIAAPEKKVAPEEKSAPPERLERIEAKVELVHDKIVVLTAGAKAGVKEGREFEIRRGGVRIARAQVTRVTQDYSGAKISSIEEGEEVRPGDAAIAEVR